MGITFVTVKVSNPARPKQSAVHELLFDSGAVYSLLPVKDLKALGIKPVLDPLRWELKPAPMLLMAVPVLVPKT